MVAQSRNSYLEAEIHAPSLDDLGAQLAESGATFHTYLEHLVQGLQKEAKEKFKGWVTCSSPDNTDLAFKKVRFPPLQNVCFTAPPGTQVPFKSPGSKGLLGPSRVCAPFCVDPGNSVPTCEMNILRVPGRGEHVKV